MPFNMQIANNNNSKNNLIAYLTTAYANSTIVISFMNIHTHNTETQFKVESFFFCSFCALSMFLYNLQATIYATR